MITEEPAEEIAAETPVPEETEVPEPIPMEEPENDRPVITHRYSTVILCDDLPGISYYAENVISVIDPEDGELQSYNIGGVVGPYSEDDMDRWRHPEDNPEIVQAHGSPFFYSMGFRLWQGSVGTVPVVTVAYDSLGQVSYEEYEIIYIEQYPDDAIKEATVLVDGLRVRKTPSASGEILGNVWKNAGYYIYESTEKDGYTWYRIGDDMWIADNGEWLEFN